MRFRTRTIVAHRRPFSVRGPRRGRCRDYNGRENSSPRRASVLITTVCPACCRWPHAHLYIESPEEEVHVHGSWDPKFQVVTDILAESLERGDDLGASVLAAVDGSPVVDIWGERIDVREGETVGFQHDRQRLVHDEDDDGAVRPHARGAIPRRFGCRVAMIGRSSHKTARSRCSFDTSCRTRRGWRRGSSRSRLARSCGPTPPQGGWRPKPPGGRLEQGSGYHGSPTGPPAGGGRSTCDRAFARRVLRKRGRRSGRRGLPHRTGRTSRIPRVAELVPAPAPRDDLLQVVMTTTSDTPGTSRFEYTAIHPRCVTLTKTTSLPRGNTVRVSIFYELGLPRPWRDDSRDQASC